MTKTPFVSGQVPGAEPHQFPHLDPGPEWMAKEELLCTPEDVRDLFYSPLGPDREEARALCGGCPFRVPCLTQALENGEVHGIWGGVDMTFVKEREQARKTLRVDVRPKPAPAPRADAKRPRADARLGEIKKLWEQGRTDHEIGLKLGLHPSTIAYTRKHALGLPAKFGPGGRRLKKEAVPA